MAGNEDAHMDKEHALQQWKDAHTALLLLEPYVDYGLKRVKRGGELSFELRIPVRQVLGVYRVLSEMLGVDQDESPLMEPLKATLGHVRHALEGASSNREPTRGRRRK